MAKYIKTYSDTYIYKVYPSYEEQLFKYIMSAAVVDKTSENFKDAKYEIKKRAVSSAFIDCMESDNVVFLHGSISKPFLVVTAKDLKQRATHEMAMNKYLDECGKIKPQKKVDDTNVDTPTIKTNKGNMKATDVNAIESQGNVVYDMNFHPNSPPPMALKEDVAVGSPLKVFVNVDMCMDDKDVLREPEVLISLLTSAITNLMYYKMPEKLFSYNMLDFGSSCFTKLFVHVLDLIAKISVMDGAKSRCEYLASKYFHSNIACTYEAGKAISNFSQSVRAKAIKDSELSSRESDVIDSVVPDEAFVNIKLFIEAVSDYLKLSSSLTIDNFLEKWMYMYGGPQTAFGLEYFPNFATIITDAYNGCYLNNQKTIEKICGNDMVGFTKGLLSGI